MADQPLMCGARDCINWYLVPVVAGRDPSKYCSKTCNRREAKHRKRDRLAPPAPAPIPRLAAPPKPEAPVKKYSKRNLGSEIEMVGLCPRPYKAVFRTEEEAEAEIERLDKGYMDVYRCKCGALHIGHPTPQQQERMAKQEYNEWAKTLTE